VTYCLGWRTDSEVFLLADGAVTSTQPIVNLTSSFGEPQQTVRSTSVQEAALKIFRYPNAAITLSGDGDIGHEFAANVRAFLNTGLSPDEAFRNSASSITAPGQVPSIRAMIAYYADGCPQLTSFNENGDAAILKNREIVHLGALHSNYFGLIETYLHNFQQDCVEPDSRIACALGLCQSLAVQDQTLQWGVGGPFCGIYVDEHGTHWQPDLSYGLNSPANIRETIGESITNRGNLMTCAVRDDIFFVSSPYTGGISAFTVTRDDDDASSVINRANSQANLINEITGNQKIDYMVFISETMNIGVIVQTKGNMRTKHLDLNVQPVRNIEGRAVITFGFSQELGEYLLGSQVTNPKDTHILFLRYKEPD
jgi:hypothetical protein